MSSNHLHLIALIVAVFFAGVYLRGESARKKDIKRQIAAIEERQDEINGIVAEIDRVTAEKDSLLRLQIAVAKFEIAKLDRKEAIVRSNLDSSREVLSALEEERRRLIAQINAVPDLDFDSPTERDVDVDPDLVPGGPVANTPVRTFVAPQIAEQIAEEAGDPLPSHAGVAKIFADRGVREVPPGSNRGPDVERFLAAVGLEAEQDRFGNWKSYPYCAAFVSFCLDEAGSVLFPRVRSAASREFITNRSIPAEKVMRGSVKIDPGTLIIWKRNIRDPKDWRGHMGIVIDWEGQAGTTIEANTSSGDEGDQRDGEGVYIRKRMFSPGSAFRITHFTPVVYR